MPVERGVQLFSDFAPGGSLSDWITAAAGRDPPFGRVALTRDSVRISLMLSSCLLVGVSVGWGLTHALSL